MNKEQKQIALMHHAIFLIVQAGGMYTYNPDKEYGSYYIQVLKHIIKITPTLEIIRHGKEAAIKISCSTSSGREYNRPKITTIEEVEEMLSKITR